MSRLRRFAPDAALAAFLVTLLASLYALSYSGTFTADDEHIFASGALSLARRGQIDTAAVYGNTRLRWLESLPDYAPVEPGLAAVGSLFVRLADLTGVGAVQALFLLNAPVTALTAGLVFLTARAWGYRPALAALSALLYGAATMAWPYAKTFFRDPLAALLLAGAYLAYTFAMAEGRTTRARVVGWSLVAVCLAAGTLVKSTVALAIPILPLAGLIHAWVGRPSGRAVLIPFAAVAAIGAAAIGAVLLAPPTGPFARFSSPYLRFLLDFFLHTPHPAFAEAVLGPLASPGKSAFVYSPVLVLAPVSVVIGWRSKWRELLVPAVTLFALIVAQALFYDDEWWGHTNWGLRYLLPALPLLAVACAPPIDALLSSRSRGVWAAAGALGLASVLVQLGGVAVSTTAYYPRLFEIRANAPWTLAVWDPRYSAVLGHWRMLLEGDAWNFAWARLWPLRTVPVALVTLGWAGALAVSAWGIHRQLRALPVRPRTAALLAVSLGLGLVLPYATLRAYAPDPAYFSDRPAFREAVTLVDGSALDGDVILVHGYGLPLWTYALNSARTPIAWYGLPVHFPTPDELHAAGEGGNPALALDPWTVQLLEGLPANYGRAWLLSAEDEPPGNFRLEEEWLSRRYPRTGEWAWDGSGRVRVSLFLIRPPAQP